MRIVTISKSRAQALMAWTVRLAVSNSSCWLQQGIWETCRPRFWTPLTPRCVSEALPYEGATVGRSFLSLACGSAHFTGHSYEHLATRDG